MPSTYSSNLRVELQATGENTNTWGDKLNVSLQLLEAGVAGMTTVNTTGGTTVLTTNNGSADQSRAAILKITGTLASNATIQIPAVTKTYVVWNATSGAFTVTIKTSGGTGAIVEQGNAGIYVCDATDTISALGDVLSQTPNATATGAIQIPAGTTAQRPSGAVGKIRWNSTLNQYEGYDGSTWDKLGGGATGAAGNPVFHENDQTVTGDYTIPATKNAVTAGPITIASGVTVTVSSGATWTVV